MTIQHIIKVNNQIRTIKRVNVKSIELTTGETVWPFLERLALVVDRGARGRYTRTGVILD